MDVIQVRADARHLARGQVRMADLVFPCALGRAGISGHKKEGDHATPAGEFALREIFYRPDRLPPPETGLPIMALEENLGWCDAPAHMAYNRPIRFPFPASAERLWRQDALYDVIAVIGYNDAPVIAGKGSAIFMHVAGNDYPPTEGCVALAREDLCALLRRCTLSTRIAIHSPKTA
jgi:L,D-peptidoglycan transpeptidase YkuD (ErfK/YbiS/YcfS/YnhG family)